ncbi:MAG: hypothetical protein M3R63_23735 [Actinomycetota bacterium]|nr:hypothetical protein [Actinomycetota bacterium]
MTTGDRTWIDAIDARLAAGATVELPGEVADGPVAVDRVAWGELWPFDGVLDTITRAEVAAVARSRDWPALLRAVCVWGHGAAGYGPFRVRRLLGDRDVGAKLDAAVTVLRGDGAVGAYAAMLTGDARIPGFGPAFFTKFLAFSHPVVGIANGHRALVVDRAVARTMVEATAAVLCAAVLTPDGSDGVEPWPAALPLWRDPWPAHRYAVYLDWAAAVAERTGRTPEGLEIGAAELGRRLLRPTAVGT